MKRLLAALCLCSVAAVAHAEISQKFGNLEIHYNALTTDEVYRQMVLLATSEAYRQQLGAASRKWVEDYHGWRYVAGLHLELYRELLGRSLPTEAANQAAAQAKVTRARLWGGPEPDGS